MKYLFLLLLFLPFTISAQLQGRAQLDSLIQTLPAAKEDTNKVKLINTISFLHYAYDPEKGIKYGQEGIALAEKLHWDNGVAGAYNSIGTNYQSVSDNKHALEYYLKAYEINERTGNKRNMAKNLGNIGVMYVMESNYTKALEYLFRVLKIFEELKDKNGIATQLVNIASIYEEQKLYSKALQYDSMALKEYRELNSADGIAVVLGNTGNVYVEMGDYDKALLYIKDAIKRSEQLGHKESVARNLSNLSDIYSRKKDYYKALDFQFQAMKIHEQIGNVNAVGVSQINIANTYNNIAEDSLAIKPGSLVPGNKTACLQLAISYARKAIAIHKNTNNVNGLSFDYKVLANAQMGVKNYKDAIESFLQHSLFKDSVFSIENNKKISNLENQRELDLRESRIQILTQDNKLKNLTAEKHRLTNRALIGGIAMLLIIVCSIVMYYVRKQRTEKLIANEKINTLLKDQELRSVSNMLEVQEQERKRIAADLHDRLGSMLSTVKLYFNSVEQQIDSLKEQNREQYHKATNLLDEACDEVRKISHNLVSGELVKFGLVSALNQLKDTIMETGQIDMEVLAFGMEERLDSTMEISLYRVIQELMNNILKHSKATKVSIQLNKVDNNLNIVVEDNGVGFDVTAALAKDGMGLRNMETRVKKLNGTIAFDSVKGRGATVIIDLPA